MKKIPVNVKGDHIGTLVASKNPIASISELVWNSLDADATSIAVKFEENGLGALERIRVSDNGTGIPYDEAESLFGSLGGSWKAHKTRTKSGRSLHGKSGKGRFKAFALGSLVEWKTTAQQNGSVVNYAIKGAAKNLESFELSDPVATKSVGTGTEVVVCNILKNFTSLTSNKAPQEITNYFALYLSEYPGISISYNGTILDPGFARKRFDELPLGEIALPDGKTTTAELTVIEWKEPQDRALHLCDSSGISLHEVSPGIHAPGFNFTAYLNPSSTVF